MISDQQLSELFDVMVLEEETTTKRLKELKISQYDISKLIERKILVRVKRGFYDLCSSSELKIYAEDLIHKGLILKAIPVLKKIFELGNANREIVFQLFINAIREINYEETFKYFDILVDQYGESFHKSDYNLYIILMSYLFPSLPERYFQELSFITLNDTLVSNEEIRIYNTEFENKIRTYIYNSELTDAYKLLSKYNPKSAHEYCVYILLKRSIERSQKYINILIEIITSGEYEKALEFMISMHKENMWHYIDKCTIHLLKILIDYKNGKYIPEKIEYSGYSIRDAILHNDFIYLMQRLDAIKVRSHKLLLTEIKKIIDANAIKPIKTLAVSSSLKEQKVNAQTIKSDDLFPNLLQALQCRNLNDIKNGLRLLFPDITDDMYQIITRLYFIDLIVEDISFSDTIKAILALKNGEFEQLVPIYLRFFKECIKEKHFLEAELYLEVLEICNKVYNLNMSLESAKKLLKVNKNDSIDAYETIKSALSKSYRSGREWQFYLPKTVPFPTDDELEKICSNTVEKEQFYVFENYGTVANEILFDKLKSFKEIKLFWAGNVESGRIVITPDHTKGNIDPGIYIQNGKNAYALGDYNSVIYYYNRAINTFKYPKHYVFVTLANAYYKAGKLTNALKCLIVANEMTFYIKDIRPHDDLIESLSYEIYLSEKKKRRDLQTRNDEIDKIVHLISIGQLDIANAVALYNLTEEEIEYVKSVTSKDGVGLSKYNNNGIQFMMKPVDDKKS